MTTIAYNFKDKQIAVDSRCSSGSVIISDTANKVIINDLGIWFFAGTVADRAQLVTLSIGDHATHDIDGAALLIRDDEVFLVYIDGEDFRYCEVKADCNDTLGSGGMFALAAMDFDMTAAEAVAYAMQRDVYTGGAIQVYDMHGIMDSEISKY